MPFTCDQLRAGYLRNTHSLALMLRQAEQTSRKVNGFSADVLRERVSAFDALSHASDAELCEHLRRKPTSGATIQALADATTAEGLKHFSRKR